jgi:hypothetical protein
VEKTILGAALYSIGIVCRCATLPTAIVLVETGLATRAFRTPPSSRAWSIHILGSWLFRDRLLRLSLHTWQRRLVILTDGAVQSMNFIIVVVITSWLAESEGPAPWWMHALVAIAHEIAASVVLRRVSELVVLVGCNIARLASHVPTLRQIGERCGLW